MGTDNWVNVFLFYHSLKVIVRRRVIQQRCIDKVCNYKSLRNYLIFSCCSSSISSLWYFSKKPLSIASGKFMYCATCNESLCALSMYKYICTKCILDREFKIPCYFQRFFFLLSNVSYDSNWGVGRWHFVISLSNLNKVTVHLKSHFHSTSTIFCLPSHSAHQRLLTYLSHVYLHA